MDADASFPANWTAPPELERALPREVRMSGLGRFKAVFSVLLIVAAVPVFLFFRREADAQTARNAALREQGAAATGEITRVWHRGRSSTPMVTYAFSANGVRFRGDAPVPRSLWDRVQTAGMIPIRYLPANPGINHPAEWEDAVVPVWMAFILPGVLVISGAVFLVNLRKQSELLSAGVPAPGVVTGCYRMKGGWAVSFKFRTPDGTVIARRSTSPRKLETGAAICVLYDAENPRRSRPYPMDSYRVA